MCKKLVYLISFVLVLGLVSSSYGVVIGDWENSDDGWISWGDSQKSISDPTLMPSKFSYSTDWISLGTNSLKLTKSGWNQNLAIKLQNTGHVADFLANTKFAIDVTYPATTIGGGFQEIYQVVLNAPGWGWKALTAEPVPGTHVEYGATGGPQSTFTLTIDYSSALPSIGTNPGYVEFVFATNSDPNHGVFYFDNARLTRDEVVVGYSGKVIGNFEDVNDGWGRWTGPTPAPEGLTTSYSTTGATLAAKSFKMYTPEAGWRTAIYVPLQNRGFIKDFLRNETFSLDVTWLTSDWSSGTSNNWVNLELIINADGIGWVQQGRPDTDTANASFPGGWDTTNYGASNTRTVTWNYSQYVDGNPDNNEISADANYLELIVVTNYADGFLPANGGYGGIYYFDNAKLIGGDVVAYNPSPSDLATQVGLYAILSWRPGIYAATHNVYLGTDENTVRDANTANPRGVLVSPNQSTTTYDPCGTGPMAFNQTYYWRVDEVNNSDPCSPWKGKVWSFTTQDYRDVDNFESYTNTAGSPNIIYKTWKDGKGYSGYGGNGTGSQVGYRDPNYAELTIVHGGEQSMPFDYNNTKSPYDSNATRTFDTPQDQDWAAQGVQGVTLWLRGYQKDVGSFTRSGSNPNYIYTMTASGTDIGNVKNLRNSLFHDEFHYACMQVEGDYTIVARVNSVTNTDASAKAGLMIRDSTDADSAHAMVCITPGSGVWFQHRDTTGGPSFSTTQGGINAPCWLKLKRHWDEFVSSYFYNAWYSTKNEPNQHDWTQLGDPDSIIINMTDPVCIGLSLTAHNAAATCTGVFSGVTVNDETPPSWTHQDIGIKSNTAAPLYVTLQDSSTPAKTATVTHSDPNIVLTGAWQEWNIPLSRFTGVDMTKVKKITIGTSNKVSHLGVGTLYFDDIQLYVPKCNLSKRSASFARADYYPNPTSSACGTAGDCELDGRELQIMAGDWLVRDRIITPTTDPNIAGGLLAYYPLDEGSGTTIADAANDPCHAGTFSASGVSWVLPGLMGNSAIDVNGAAGSRISIGTWDPVGPSGGFTLSLWARWAGPRVGITSQGLIGKRDGWDNTTVRFMFEVFGDNQLRLGEYASNAYSQANIMQQYMCRWAHIAVTYAKAEPNNVVTFYLNGQNVGSGTTFTLGPNTSATMTIGNSQSATAWPDAPEVFNGRIDEVRIYNRALSADEIAYLADLTPGDGKLYISILSPAELYEGEPEGSKSVNLRDFAYLANAWLEKELWPR